MTPIVIANVRQALLGSHFACPETRRFLQKYPARLPFSVPVSCRPSGFPLLLKILMGDKKDLALPPTNQFRCHRPETQWQPSTCTPPTRTFPCALSEPKLPSHQRTRNQRQRETITCAPTRSPQPDARAGAPADPHRRLFCPLPPREAWTIRRLAEHWETIHCLFLAIQQDFHLPLRNPAGWQESQSSGTGSHS